MRVLPVDVCFGHLHRCYPCAERQPIIAMCSAHKTTPHLKHRGGGSTIFPSLSISTDSNRPWRYVIAVSLFGSGGKPTASAISLSTNSFMILVASSSVIVVHPCGRSTYMGGLASPRQRSSSHSFV